MKNNLLLIKVSIAFAFVLSSANACYSIPEKLIPLKSSISDFILVLFGIIFFLGIIFIGLSVYNKVFISNKMKDYELKKYNLADSVDKDDAILNYVTKNKLR